MKRLLRILFLAAVAFAPGCKTISGSSGSTGKVQVTKDAACQATLGEADANGVQVSTLTCDVPQLKDSAGNCTMVGLDTGQVTVGSSKGKPVKCEVSVKASEVACRAVITTTCTWSAPPATGGTS